MLALHLHLHQLPRLKSRDPKWHIKNYIGEWALTTWDGTLVQVIYGERLHSLPRVLVVERHPDGWAGCKFTEPQCASGQFFAVGQFD